MLFDGLRILSFAFLAALGAVALVRTEEPESDTPVLALPGRVVVKTDGKEVGELSGRTIAVAYHSDGKRLASVTSNKGSELVKRPYVLKDNSLTTNDLPSASSALKLWDARDGKELRVQIDGFPAVVAAFSHHGEQLVMAFSGVRSENKILSGTVKLWDVASGKELLSLKGHEQQIQSLALSSDGEFLAAGGITGDGTTSKSGMQRPARSCTRSVVPAARRCAWHSALTTNVWLWAPGTSRIK
jgi:WD40 repeat protein